MSGIISILERELDNPESGWSIGSFGAIGEFHQDAGERLVVDDIKGLTRATERGAIRIEPSAEMEPVAYEMLSPRPQRWSQGVALCLPDAKATTSRRSVLTELGPDHDAIRPRDRNGILFDIGLSLPQTDFCIRTSDPALREILRTCCGKPTFSSQAGSAVLKFHPHRVVISKLGRAEVYQKIGGPETGGKSPEGPHTHVLPKLIAARRTHSANTPIPDGLVPCAYLHPASPVLTPLGDDKPFDRARFDTFESYLERFGLPAYVEQKRKVWSALDRNEKPETMVEPKTRLERVGLRNALRQAARQAEMAAKPKLIATIGEWRAYFDKADEPDPAEQ